jgi:hypothetical protein
MLKQILIHFFSLPGNSFSMLTVVRDHSESEPASASDHHPQRRQISRSKEHHQV